MRNFKFCWHNCGMMRMGFDIAKISVEISTNLKIVIDSNGIKIEDEMYNWFQDKNSDTFLDVKTVWEQLDRINYPEQKEFREDGCDGFAWNLEIDDRKYSGYLSIPAFLEDVLEIIKYKYISEYAETKFSKYIN